MKKFTKVLAIVLVVAMSVVMLAACTPASAEKADDKMTDKGYSAISSTALGVASGEKVESSAAYGKDFSVSLSGIKGEWVVAVWYVESADAKTEYEDIKAEYEEKEGMSFGKSGKCVYYGTKQAVKDFKGF